MRTNRAALARKKAMVIYAVLTALFVFIFGGLMLGDWFLSSLRL
ncbi:MAG: hypothetical protein RL458_1063 [Pseudomonadota bacterium]|jgi:hypothetical protein